VKKIVPYFIGLALLAAPNLCFSQYFLSLYDIDSSDDWGVDIFVQPDSSYMTFGSNFNPRIYEWALFNLHVASDGSTLETKKIFEYDSAQLYMGNPGEMRKLLGGGFITPLNIQINYGSARGWSGFLKYNSFGDTVMLRTYTDTSMYYDAILSCGIMPDNGYLLGGGHGLNTPSDFPGYMIRTDSLGDTLWTHTYQVYPDSATYINNVIPLPDSRIAVGAQVEFVDYAGPPYHLSYIHYTPWFFLTDSNGNIIRDTMYTNGFLVGGNCGELYNDMNGGYINIGQFDSLYTSDPSDLQNFPGYIAHLDTNFRITWITSFPYDTIYQHRQPVVVRQLRDSSYVVFGDDQLTVAPVNQGWAAGISRTGAITWCRALNNGMKSSYLRDMAQTASGSLVFTGNGFGDTLPNWREGDAILLGVDSNGCEESGGCGNGLGTGVATSPVLSKGGVIVYPNPTGGIVTFAYNVQDGTKSITIAITNTVGQNVATIYTANNAGSSTWDPRAMPQGIYLYQASDAKGIISQGKIVVE